MWLTITSEIIELNNQFTNNLDFNIPLLYSELNSLTTSLIDTEDINLYLDCENFSKTFFNVNSLLIHNIFETITSHDIISETINTPTNQKVWGEKKKFTNYYDYTAYLCDLELERRHRLRPDLSKEKILQLLTGLDSECLEYWLTDTDEPLDSSNMIEWRGKMVNVSELSSMDQQRLILEVDDVAKLVSLEFIQTNYFSSIPDVKLFYPLPYTASPSFIQEDLFFLHIMQYQFWLWFVFIFLIVFFFLTFLCTVRWCSMRTQPRRETRGVSRSKCGDLITACVPVTWAASIIISESTDATENFDGFNTNELTLGIRAYQWGWEYYFPKSLDLQYNVKPNYSEFIGNSLRYNSASEKTLDANNVWKYYQSKQDDMTITPAHLLVLPIDNNKMFNFMNLENVGANTSKESSAFKKIRTYSKVYNTNLVHTPSTFINKYSKINSLYMNENLYSDSLNYGLKRQHNLTSIAATTNTYSTFLDKNSMDKYLNYNLQLNSSINKNKTDNYDIDLNNFTKTDSNILSSNETLDVYLKTSFKTSDLNNPRLDNNNILLNNVKSDIENLLKKNHKSDDFNATKTEDNIKMFTSDRSTTQKTLSINSTDQSFLPSDQSIRKYSKLNPKDTNYNLSLGLNNVDSNLRLIEKRQAYNDLNSLYQSCKTEDMDQSVLIKLLSNRFFFDDSYNPTPSNNPNFVSIDYDSTSSNVKNVENIGNKVKTITETIRGDLIPLLQGRRDGAPKTLTSTYWQMFWANSNVDLRVTNMLLDEQYSNSFSLPLFTNYYDYDFRNAQALELMEESFWESSYSSYNHLDYLNITDSFTKLDKTPLKDSRRDSYYFLENIDNSNKVDKQNHPFTKDLSLTGSFYANNIQLDDFISPADLVQTKNFYLMPTFSNCTLLDDSYLNYKNLLSFYNSNSSFYLNTNFNSLYPQSYKNILNNFRADFEDFVLHVDLNQNQINKKPDFTLADNDYNEKSTLVNSDLSENGTSRFSNPITLRTTARNSIVTYNALQKVFKARFEDGRSNLKISHFSDLKTPQPFITDSRVPYEKLLGKNKESFYNTTFYKNNTFSVLNDFASYNSSLNYYFFDFPFLLALKSDSSRYLWFDWFAKWAMFEVQPSSISRYSTLGVPYSKKHFDFNVDSGEEIQDTETYFTRIAKARKNYLPMWSYTPYLYSRSNIWYSNSKLNILNVDESSTINSTDKLLSEMNWYWTSYFYINNTSQNFTPSHSGNNNNGHSNWRPYSSIQAYYYHTSNLVDILTKREYLYRQYFETHSKIINLPNTLTANPKNPLLSELKASFLFIDPITYNSEYSRELYYNSLSYFKFMLLKDWLITATKNKSNLPINLNMVNNYLFYYFFDANKSSKIGNNLDLYKNQYRPMKKGVTSMLRLHATGAVAMPIETRLQILASSRDVIHSWSIPSAGIKIDCVPGYTSHRIMTFLNSGIYWGQCQEICGRYHHWMPIVIYFMKRDLFFLWCTHFMFSSSANDIWETNDRQFNDYIRFVSYDKHSWLTEVSN